MHPDEDQEKAIAQVEASDTCPYCDGTGYANDGGDFFPCYCELGCEIADESENDCLSSEWAWGDDFKDDEP